MPPTFFQRLFLFLFPASWAESMVAESRMWKAKCKCGHACSIWDLGGIRWKATGKPWTWMTCPVCQKRTWHSVVKDLDSPPVSGVMREPNQPHSRSDS